MFSPKMSLRVLVFLLVIGFSVFMEISNKSEHERAVRSSIWTLSEDKQSDDVEIFNFKV